MMQYAFLGVCLLLMLISSLIQLWNKQKKAKTRIRPSLLMDGDRLLYDKLSTYSFLRLQAMRFQDIYARLQIVYVYF